MRLIDRFDRTIDYMRISITDKCNLRCTYCVPSCGVAPITNKDIMTDEEIFRVTRAAAKLGVRKIRLTGGEPLARKDVVKLVASLKTVRGIENISMTTNGIMLEKYAQELANAGLDRVNISLDSFRPNRYKEITRGGSIDAVLKGIKAAEAAGLLPIKINMVPIRGFNDDEIEEFARLTLSTPYHVRYIEFMPIGGRDFWNDEKYIPTDEIKAIAEKIGPLTPVKLRKTGPARYYRFDNAPGILGFISALTHHFCGDCNRLRITSDGKLRPCLFSETEIDLKPALRNSAPEEKDEEIERLLRLAIDVKPEGHHIDQRTDLDTLKPMSRIGG